jgi:8-oxo-dGTP pyrophosphatase MutT (NUDIX family)
MQAMIVLDQENARFHYRVAAIIFDDARVLLQTDPNEDFWFMPGGRVEMLEPAEESLSREMREELGEEVRIERLVWLVENFFEYQEISWHEMGMYFLASLPDGSPLLAGEGPLHTGYEDNGAKLVFQWHELSSLPGLTLYPSFLRGRLGSLPAATEHIVQRDGKL